LSLPLSEKAERATHHRNPGEDCRADGGAYHPTVDRKACEGKHDCVEVCPYDVFEARRIADADFLALSFVGKRKSRLHGAAILLCNTSESLPGVCGQCVAACPEHAITLISKKTGRSQRCAVESG